MQTGRLQYSQWRQKQTIKYFTIFGCLYIIKLDGTYRTRIYRLAGCNIHNGTTAYSKIFSVLFSVVCTLSNLMVLFEPEYAVWLVAIFTMGATEYSKKFYYFLLFEHYQT